MIQTKTDMRVAFENMPVKSEQIDKMLKTNAGVVRHRKSWHVQRQPVEHGCCAFTGWWCQGKRTCTKLKGKLNG